MTSILAYVSLSNGELYADGYTMSLGSLPAWINTITVLIALVTIAMRAGQERQKWAAGIATIGEMAHDIKEIRANVADVFAKAASDRAVLNETVKRVERVERRIDETR